MGLRVVIQRRRRRKSERGTAVLTVVMAVTLLLAIGVLAVRNAGLADQAIGYSRMSSQTLAVAELGTSAAVAELGANKAASYVMLMQNPPPDPDDRERCLANTPTYPNAPCARLFRTDLERSTSVTMFQAKSTAQPNETGSFGMASSMMGDFAVEITELGPTGKPVAGNDIGNPSLAQKFAKVTMTTTAQVRPLPKTAGEEDICNESIATATSKKVMRARVVIGPI